MGNVRIIGASAGSGKTYRLAYEYVKSVVGDPSLYRRILAVTFTNKATEEMRSRILERLHELAVGAPSPYVERLLNELAPMDEQRVRARAAEAQRLILHDYSRFAVLTIDRFFQRLIRSFIRELGVDVNFNIELETDSLLSLAADALIDESTDNESLRKRLFAAARDQIDAGRRWNVKEPLLALGRELFGEEYQRARGGSRNDAVDGARNSARDGSAADCSPSPAATSSLVEAVVKRAKEAQTGLSEKAGRMLQIIEQYGLTAADFKGKSKGLVAYLTKVAVGGFLPLSNYARQELESETLLPQLRGLLGEIDTIYKDNFRLVASARLLAENHRNFLLLADLQQRIERICIEQNIMPISETNRMIARLVAGNDTPFIFEKAGSYFTRFMIDEFQDTSSSQWENFVPLLRNAIAGEPGLPVMLIGDIKQAIYRWRGGDWQILSRRVREEMGADRVEAETLDTNYRSMRRMVEFNNRAVGLVAEAGNAALNNLIASGLSEGALPAAEAASLTGMLAEAYSGHTQKPENPREEGYVTLTVYDADDQGVYVPPVIEKIEELQSRGYAAGDIAVLVPTNRQGALVAQMLLARKAEMAGAGPVDSGECTPSPYCYDVVTQEALTVGASAASRFIIACLSLAADRDDTIQRAVYDYWLGREFDAPLTTADTAFFARLAALSPEEAFEEIVLRFGLQGRANDIAYIQAVHQQITAFSSRSVADIPLFLKWWGEKGATASITMQGTANAITISTIHKSKGLQYKVVIVPYMSWVMAPDTRGRQLVVWAATEEEGLESAGALPINYREQMSESFFAPRYYREQVLAHIDAMNMFYVAVTRAEQELHLMTSSNPRNGKNSIGNVLRAVLGVGEGSGEVLTFGSPVYPEGSGRGGDGGSAGGAGSALKSYPTARPTARMRTRISETRLTGVSMHAAMESASTFDDVCRALGRVPADPLVAGWFDGDWDEVKRENNIIVTGNGTAKRPDRVMLRGKKAVVVDYKFGRAKSPEHSAQLRDYMKLLCEMGYTDVEGYIWYVSLDGIEKIAQ